MTELLLLLSPWIAFACLIIWDAREPSREAAPEREFEPKDVSPDFAALIHAVQREGRAYRREERREDRGKNIREWTTIVLVALTFIAVCYQVHEMIKVYEPIKEQADASKLAADSTKRAADAATRQSEIATRQAEIANRQADNSDRALLQAQRAWIGPRDARLESKPVAGQKNKFVVEYQNTGKEPALSFVFDARSVAATAREEQDGTLNNKMTEYLSKCLGTPARGLAGVVFPTSGFSAAQLAVDVDEKLIDDDVASGKKTLLIQGCFAYQTGNITRHSAFCFFYGADRTDIAHLNVCLSGNYAD